MPEMIVSGISLCMARSPRRTRSKVVQIAPAVRAAWGEEFNLAPSFATAKRLVSVLKKIGFDYVFDTNFAADLTIMEEGSEYSTDSRAT